MMKFVFAFFSRVIWFDFFSSSSSFWSAGFSGLFRWTIELYVIIFCQKQICKMLISFGWSAASCCCRRIVRTNCIWNKTYLANGFAVRSLQLGNQEIFHVIIIIIIRFAADISRLATHSKQKRTFTVFFNLFYRHQCGDWHWCSRRNLELMMVDSCHLRRAASAAEANWQKIRSL